VRTLDQGIGGEQETAARGNHRAVVSGADDDTAPGGQPRKQLSQEGELARRAQRA
jgi:hypothetical protein